MNKLYHFPYYLLLMAVYPSLSLLATNFMIIGPKNIIRPLMLSIFFSLAIYYLFLRIFKNKFKSGVLATIFIFIFFNYGRAVIFLKHHVDITESLGNNNHFLVGIISVFLFWLGKKMTGHISSTNITSIYLICITLLILPSYSIGKLAFQDKKIYNPPEVEFPTSVADKPLPDIYHIVLDAYSRSDFLSQIGYDNSDFINFLRANGFYVAECSSSNYSRTALSLTSTLNLDYLWRIFPEKNISDRDDSAIYAALSNNLARNALQQLGYQFITSTNGYFRSEHTKYADILINPQNPSVFVPYVSRFERLYLNNSALAIFTNLSSIAGFSNGYLLNGQHYELVTSALEHLKAVPEFPGPKYSFIHLLVPHEPYIFDPNGSITPKISGEQGYIRNIEYINSQLKPIISSILKNSETQPIIVIHGDHGYIPSDTQKYLILYALYLPGEYQNLYPSLSPVNTYRIVFNHQFDLNLSLLDDKSIHADIGAPFRKDPANLPDKVKQCPQAQSK